MVSVKNALNSIFITHVVNHNPNLLSRAPFDCLLSGLLSSDLVIFRGEKLLKWRKKNRKGEGGKIMPSRLTASPIGNICAHTTDTT